MARRSFRSASHGAVAVEFALLLPVMVAMLFGSISAASLVRASMKIWNVAQAIGDLVAQQTSLSAAQMNDFCKGGALTLAPLSGGFTATVASVTYVAGGSRVVNWQDTTCGGTAMANALALGTPYTPNAGDSVIVAQATYVYSFPPSYILPPSFTFTRTTYSRPRAGTAVVHS
jgi:Flp pilus assembly protein TadG